MQTFIKKSLSLFLTLIIVFSVMPASVLADLVDNSPEDNNEILREIKEAVGDEKTAREYYDLLKSYNLLDDSGNILQDKSIVIDEKKYTVLQLRSLLSGEYDKDKIAYVDGTSITLGNLKTILDIEDYISYIRENYVFQDEWSEEQTETFQKWVNELQSGNITVTTQTNSSLEGNYSGINHGAVVTFATPNVDYQASGNGKVVISVSAYLSGAKEGQIVSFEYTFVPGTASFTPADYSTATITAAADGKGRCILELEIDKLTRDDIYTNDAPVLYLEARNIKNAVFSDGITSSTAITEEIQMDATEPDTPSTFEFSLSSTFPANYTVNTQLKSETNIADEHPYGDYAIRRGWLTYAKVTNYTPASSGMDGISGEGVSYYQFKVDARFEDRNTYNTTQIADIRIYSDPRVSGDNFTGSIYSKQDNGVTISQSNYNNSSSNYIAIYLEATLNLDFDIPVTVGVQDVKAPTATASVPVIEYAEGQYIPVTLTFSEPVKSDTVTAVLNGDTYYPVGHYSGEETSISTAFTFLYPASELLDDITSTITVSRVTGVDLVGHNISWKEQLLENVAVKAKDVFQSFTATTGTLDETDLANPVLDVELTISDVVNTVQWLASDLDMDGVSKNLTAVISNTEKASFELTTDNIPGGTLTASIPLKREDTDRTCTIELYYGEELIFEYFQSFTLEANKYISEDNISTALIVKNKNGGFYICENPDDPVIYVQDSPVISARFELDSDDYTYGDTSKITYFNGADLKDDTAYFAWKSSDTGIALIDANGKITPTGKAGKVKFILYAFNNGTDEKKVIAETDELVFDTGLTPFIVMPNDSLVSEGGASLPVYWSSNIPDKDKNAQFTVTVKRGEKTVYTEKTNSFMAEIPGNVLTYDYENTSDNTYNVIITATYSEIEYSAKGTIMVISSPAKASLSRPESYYITDAVTSAEIAYLVSGFDVEVTGDTELFELKVTRNNDTVLELHNPGNGKDGVYSGTKEITISDVQATADDPTSYRDVYTVSLQAKNGTDSSWSCDSYVFYVYDTEALRIIIDGEDTDEGFTISNIPEISQMSQEEIIALKRAIILDADLGINYEDYAWTDISDRLTWSSSDTDVAEIRYNEGSISKNIEDTSYTSFLPITQFDLTGIDNGDAEISVTHILSGLTTGANITVETLENKLYLFSCTPAAKTTITYVNGDGEECTVTSDEEGMAAIYEENGINSDVYFASSYDGADYAGTLKNSELVSGEGKTSGSALYPCNNFTLRRSAYAYIYLKDTDGTPYTDELILRAGVILNDNYLPDALFGIGEGVAATKRGDTDISVTPDSSGKIAILMDSTQWGCDGGIPGSSDKIEYVFELSVPEGYEYYPVVIEMDASRSADEVIESGDSIINMRKNKTNDNGGFIYKQSAEYINAAEGLYDTQDLLDSTDCTGISDMVPECKLTFGIMWWEKYDDLSLSGKVYAADSQILGEFKNITVYEQYPFVHYSMVEVTVDVDEDAAVNAGVGPNPQSLQLFWTESTGNVMSRHVSYTFANSIGQAENISDEGNNQVMEAVQKLTSVDTRTGITTEDGFVNTILELISSDDYTGIDEDSFSLQFVGTSDPHVYYLFVSIGMGTMREKNATGVYAIDEDNSTKTRFKKSPSLKEVKLLFTRDFSSYCNSLEKEFKQAANNDVITTVEWKASGYLQLKLTYKDVDPDNTEEALVDKSSWDTEIVSGGFSAGAGVTLSKYFNTWVGPVPVTFEMTGGGTAEISLDALTMQYIMENGSIGKGQEYLTELRFYLYGYFFGGLGIDYSVVALKIGAFGQLSFDLTCKWLNREYFYDEKENVYYYDGEEIENTNGKLSGQNMRLDGQIGILFKAKFLFMKYEKVICSVPFNFFDVDMNDWQEVNDLWDKSEEKSQTYIQNLIGTGAASYETIGDETYVTIDCLPTTEDFSYLDGEERIWNDDALMLAGSGSFTVLQSNAYPYTNPELSEDGKLMVYLSDSDGETGSVETAYAVKNGDGYTDKGVISADTLEDSGSCVAGTEDFAVAAWYSLGEGTEKDAGSVVSSEEQMIMLEGSEVYASVYDGENWKTTKLTDNSGADISPVVAVSGDKAIVAWRSVATSHVNGNVTDFDLKDEIHFRVYKNGSWSEEAILYNGTNGNVKGLNVAMLENGTSAVIYALDKDSDDSTSDDREIQWTVIDKDGVVKRTVCATSDETADENPQITTAKINETERFVAAWNSQQNDSHDVRLADFDEDGVMTLSLPQTVSSASDDSSTVISSNFRFVKGIENLSDIALIWSETNEDETGETYPGDSLKAVKFFTRSNGAIGVSAPQTLADAEDSTNIDSIDAFSNNGVIYAVSLCTAYNINKLVKYTGETETGDDLEVYVADSTSYIGTAFCDFTDEISVENVSIDDDGLNLGKDTLVEFTVKNNGINPVTRLEITVGNNKTIIDNIELASGQTGVYYADYSVPNDTLKDEEYTVKAYTDESSISEKGTVPFGRCDISITSAEIVNEGDGERTVELKLCETTDFALENSGSRVVVRFCKDSDGEETIKTVTIDDNDSFRMIEEGGYCLREVFDMSLFADTLTGELPDGGSDIYVFADIINTSGDSINRYGEKSAVVTMQSLVEKTGTDVSTDSQLLSQNGKTSAKVSVRNNYLSKTQTGNLIVTLLDEEGNIVGQKQSYDPDAEGYGLLTLEGEETADFDFSFDLMCASIDVRLESFEPVKEKSEDDNALLKLFSITERPSFDVDDFSSDKEGVFEAKIETTQADNVNLILMTESVNATVTYNGETVSGGLTLKLSPGTNTFRFNVLSGSGNVSSEYVLTVENYYTFNVNVNQPVAGGTISVSAEKAAPGENITITLTPEEGYKTENPVVTDEDGNTLKVKKKNKNTYTFSMPEGDVTVTASFEKEKTEPNPITGDDSNTLLFAALMIVSLAAIIGMVLLRKKHRK